MHEASLMTDLMRRINAIAAAERAVRVVSIEVRLGALSHMSAEHFAEHFAHAASGTIAANARIDIKLGDDPQAPDAQQIVLERVDVET